MPAVEIVEQSVHITDEDMWDISLTFERRNGKKTLVKFALSYRAMINNAWHEVIRYDNYHDFVHVQRFWRSPEPVHLKEDQNAPFDYLVNKYKKDIEENMWRYRKYMEQKVKNT
jgi:hypothetical protein